MRRHRLDRTMISKTQYPTSNISCWVWKHKECRLQQFPLNTEEDGVKIYFKTGDSRMKPLSQLFLLYFSLTPTRIPHCILTVFPAGSYPPLPHSCLSPFIPGQEFNTLRYSVHWSVCIGADSSSLQLNYLNMMELKKKIWLVLWLFLVFCFGLFSLLIVEYWS